MRHKGARTVVFLTLAALALLAAGCAGTDSTVGGSFRDGQVRVFLSAGTGSAAGVSTAGGLNSAVALSEQGGPQIQAASVTLSSILARNLEGQLIDIAMDLPVTFDLVALAQGQTVELPMGSLPAGSYDQLVVVIRAVSVTLADGTVVEVTPPGGGWTAIVRTDPFDVAEGTTTTVQLHFRAGRAFRWLNGQIDFQPEFDCDIDDGGTSGGNGGSHDGTDNDSDGD